MIEARARIALVLAAVLTAGALPSQTPIGASPPDDRIAVKTEPTANPGVADIAVYCSGPRAELFIDKASQGPIPPKGFAGSLAPGLHYVEVQLPGYYPLGAWISFAEKTAYTIKFFPTLITGVLSVEVEPADASITIDGAGFPSGKLELPVGTHLVVARRFGYTEQSARVSILDRRTSYVSFKLEKSAFAVAGFGFSRPAFNPANAGAPGRTSLEFNVTSYGSARAEIVGPEGDPVAAFDFPDMRSSNQSRGWDGLGPDGSPLPDGLYSATLVAIPAPGVPVQAEGGSVGPDGSVTAKAEVRIDSSLVVRAFGLASAVPGLLFMPDPSPQPAGTTAVEASWFSPWAKPEASALPVSAAFSAGGVATIAVEGAAEIGAGGGEDFAASTVFSLVRGGSSAFSLALFARGAFSTVPDPSMPGAGDSVELSLPFAAKLAGSGGVDVGLAFSPGALLDFSSGSPVALALPRAGLWVEGRSFRAGVSGYLPFGMSGSAPAPAWPARLAAEARLMLGSSPFVAAGYATAALRPGEAPELGVGLSLGLLF